MSYIKPLISLTCAWCGKEFELREGEKRKRLKKSKVKILFCSQQCSAKYTKGAKRKEPV